MSNTTSLKGVKNINAIWWTVVASGVIGMLASFIQTIERIDYAKNPTLPLTCDVNSVFSCSSVFDAWQSSVFGFSNSLMCIVFFVLLIGIGLAGATGSVIHKNVRLFVHFLTVFFLGFGAWYLYESAWAIGALCIFCIFCYSAVILANWAWLRINISDLPLAKSHKSGVTKMISSGADTFVWVLWAIIIAGMLALGIQH
jgi:uncharacterized membrane protein